MSANRFNKIASEVWDRLADETHGRVDPDEYRDAIEAELHAQSADDELVEDYARKLATSEEKRRTADGVPGQLDLLTGEDSSLDAYWRIAGAFVQVRVVVRDELLTKLAQEDEDLARKQTAGAKRKREATALLPYMADSTTTVEEATRRYRKDHPPADTS